VDAAGTQQLCVQADRGRKGAAQEAAAKQLLQHPHLHNLLASTAPESATIAPASTVCNSITEASSTQDAAHAWDDIMHGGAARATASCGAALGQTGSHPYNYKNQLQELVMAGRGLMTLPQYTVTSASSLDRLQRWSAVCSVLTEDGVALTVSGQPQSTKKRAEQASAAVMLQQPELQQQLASLQAASDMTVKPAMQLLHELVAHNSWAMEKTEVLSLSSRTTAVSEVVFQARVVINGHLLGVGNSRDRLQATHEAAQVALAVLGVVPAPASSRPHPTAALHPASAALPVAGAAGCRVQPLPLQHDEKWGQLQQQQQQLATSGAANAASSPPSGLPAQPASVLPVQPASVLLATTDSVPATFAGKIQRQCLDLYKQLSIEAVRQGVLSPCAAQNTVVCCFMLQRSADAPLQVVALGTGTRFCALPDNVVVSDSLRGKLLLDSHAEVIARRSLMRWLYHQAQQAFVEGLGRGDVSRAADAAARASASSVLELVPTSSSSSSSSGTKHHLAGAAADVRRTSSKCSTAVKSHCYSSWCRSHGGYSHVSRGTLDNGVSCNSSLPQLSTPVCGSLMAHDSASRDCSATSEGMVLRLRAGVQLHMYISKVGLLGMPSKK
jgi:dsRNA-specific ribonuclease